MPWEANETVYSLTGIGPNAEQQTPIVSLNPGEAAHVTVHRRSNVGDTGTDPLRVFVESAVENTAEEWARDPQESRLVAPGDPALDLFVIARFKTRVAVRVEGLTDTVDVDVKVRKDGVSL